MRYLDSRTVELDPAESIVSAWHQSLCDDGLDTLTALRVIREATDDGTWTLVVSNRVAAYLIGGPAPALHDKLAALRTNLAGEGTLASAVGTQVTIQTQDGRGLVGVHGGTLRGWSPDGDLLLDNLNGSGQGARIAWHKIVRVWH